jgi:hypothetical protein
MRLARLAVAGLGFGMLVGFGAALLRPRPRTAPVEPRATAPTGIPTTQAAFDAFGPAPRDPTNPRPDPTAGPAERPAAAVADAVPETDRPAPGTVI